MMSRPSWCDDPVWPKTTPAEGAMAMKPPLPIAWQIGTWSPGRMVSQILNPDPGRSPFLAACAAPSVSRAAAITRMPAAILVTFTRLSPSSYLLGTSWPTPGRLLSLFLGHNFRRRPGRRSEGAGVSSGGVARAEPSLSA